MAGYIPTFQNVLNDVRHFNQTIAMRFERVGQLAMEQEIRWFMAHQHLEHVLHGIEQRLAVEGVSNNQEFYQKPLNYQREVYLRLLFLHGNYKRLLLAIEIYERHHEALEFFRFVHN